MTGLLISALGLALVAWHIKALGGRISLHPGFLKTPPGPAAVFLLGAGAVAFGGALTVAHSGSGGLFFLILLGLAFVVTLLAGSARRTLIRDLREAYEGRRRDYPNLDDEALFRFIVHDRHPDWDNARVQNLTEDCGSIEELAARLQAEEN